jgi:predicted kinase
VGKYAVTRLDAGEIHAPGHGRVGAEIARRLLWQQGFCGSGEAAQFREGICTLIRYHGLPLHAVEDPDGKRRLLQMAAQGEVAKGVTVRLLCLLARADILGRISHDRQELTEKVESCELIAREMGCFHGPYPFPDAHTGRSFLKGRNIQPEYPFYDDTWGTVVLMSGLPGTGKDTWIRENLPDLPVVSLDDIRRETGISPLEDQGRVAQIARERARQLLREKRPFVWNATNITPQTRGKLVSLFEDYGAAVRIVYLETTASEQKRRNAGRPEAVPEAAVVRMLEKLTPPEQYEASYVNWIYT